jgi:hypothetical protein
MSMCSGFGTRPAVTAIGKKTCNDGSCMAVCLWMLVGLCSSCISAWHRKPAAAMKGAEGGMARWYMRRTVGPGVFRGGTSVHVLQREQRCLTSSMCVLVKCAASTKS